MIAAIGQDRENGATYLMTQAVRTLAEAAATIEDGSGWSERLTKIADRLAAAKPGMAGVKNATGILLEQLRTLGPREVRSMVSGTVEALLGQLTTASDTTAARAADLLSDSDSVLSCSYSSAVLRTAGHAQAAGKDLQITVVDGGTGSPGRRLCDDLRSMGIGADVIGMSALESEVRQARLVIVGADAITPHYVVNGTPSLELARVANGVIPFYVVCETIKFAMSIPTEPGYDRVPLALVTALVTEEGALNREELMARIEPT